MSDRVDRKVLNRFAHVECMSGEPLTERACNCEVEGRRVRGRPCTRGLDRVKKVCNAWSLELSDAKVMCLEREQWRVFVSCTFGGVNV